MDHDRVTPGWIAAHGDTTLRPKAIFCNAKFVSKHLFRAFWGIWRGAAPMVDGGRAAP
jgi:hypothetical protein